MATVDRIRGSLSSTAIKAPVRVATTANITLSGEQTIDGIAVVADDRVLVKNQSTASENGIYIAATGTWSRAADWNDERDVVTGTSVRVNVGTVNGGSQYTVTTTGDIVPGTTSIAFSALADGEDGTDGSDGASFLTGEGVPSSGLGSDGDSYCDITNGQVYTKASGSWSYSGYTLKGTNGDGSGDMIGSNNLSELTNTVTAQSNLGLGDLAVLDTVGTSQIDNDAVTLDKLVNASAQYRILARKTSSAGNWEECTLSEVLDFVTSAAQGDILYRGASAWSRLAKGTAGQILTMNAGATAPEWAAAASSAGWVKVAEATPSGAATVDFTSISSTYLDLMIVFYLVPSSGGTNLLLRTYGVDTNLDSGASDYAWSLSYPYTRTFTEEGAINMMLVDQDSADSAIRIAHRAENSASGGDGYSGVLHLNNIQASLATHVVGQTSVVIDSGETNYLSGPQHCAGWRAEKAAITGVRLVSSSGNLTGRVCLFGRTAV